MELAKGITIESKLPNLATTIFTSMTLLANEYGAINLGQGFPDFSMDPLLQELVFKAMKEGHNQYAHTNGFPGLRNILSDKIFNLYGNRVNPDSEITITPGGTYAISNALTAILNPGDEVIVFEPCFDSYIPNIRILGAVPVRISLQFPDYSIPWDEVKAKVGPKTRLILINSPHNPTGAVLSENDIIELRKIVADTNILILSDEVYEHLIFDGNEHLSILKYPDLFSRSFVAFSLGKVFHCTGWKIGYCVAPEKLMKEFRNHHQFNVFSVQSAVQVAIAEYLKDPNVYSTLPGFFQAKRNLFLQETKGSFLTPIPSKGTYFQCFSFPDSVGMSSKDFAILLTKEGGVASIPVSSFYEDGTDHNVLRFCFAKKEETLEAGGKKLRQMRI
jgi:methionine aminotransferase